jgi:hypothetical protein
MRRLLLLALGVACGAGWGQKPVKPVPVAMWVELDGTGANLRAIVAPQEKCPVVLDGKHKLKLTERPGTPGTESAFPVKTCAIEVPSKTTSVQYGTQTLKTTAGEGNAPKRIIVIGDTGCRQKAKELQDCETDWPFAKIVGFAAAQKPDLVIHVGDYYYRENCPDGAKHCESWENWRKDFFQPAEPLFAAAPWLLARGNHEMCGRASEGWFRFLDAGETPLPCPKGVQTESAPFSVRLKGLTLVSVDSADIDDAMPVDQKASHFAGHIAMVEPNPGSGAVWVVTHKPLYFTGLTGTKAADATGGVESPLTGISMVLAGHIHTFGAVDFNGARPGELIVGDSGTALQAAAVKVDKLATLTDPQALFTADASVDGKPAHASVKGRFGYMLLERSSDTATAWKGTLFGVSNEVLANCLLDGRSIRCESPEKPAPAAN